MTSTAALSLPETDAPEMSEQFLFPRICSDIPKPVRCAWVETPTKIGPWIQVEGRVIQPEGRALMKQCRLNVLLVDYVCNYVYRLNRAIDRRQWNDIDGIKEQALNDVLPVYDQISDKVSDQVAAMTLIMDYVRTIELLHHAAMRAESCPGAIRLSKSTSGPVYRYDPADDPEGRTAKQSHIYPTPYCYYDYSRRIFSHQRKGGGKPPVNDTATPDQIANIFRTTGSALLRQLGGCIDELRTHLSSNGFSNEDLAQVLAH